MITAFQLDAFVQPGFQEDAGARRTIGSWNRDGKYDAWLRWQWEMDKLRAEQRETVKRLANIQAEKWNATLEHRREQQRAGLEAMIVDLAAKRKEIASVLDKLTKPSLSLDEVLAA